MKLFIPKYPNEYVFDMDSPEGYTKQHDEVRKKLSKFLAQYGLELVE